MENSTAISLQAPLCPSINLDLHRKTFRFARRVTHIPEKLQMWRSVSGSSRTTYTDLTRFFDLVQERIGREIR